MIPISVEQIKRLHTILITETGGSDGLRDAGALESAAAQPFMTFGGVELYPEIVEKAAALSFSLICKHPFVDGNKRIGFASGILLLRANGFDVKADIDEAERAVLAVASGEMNREDWTKWLCEHLVEFKG